MSSLFTSPGFLLFFLSGPGLIIGFLVYFCFRGNTEADNDDTALSAMDYAYTDSDLSSDDEGPTNRRRRLVHPTLEDNPDGDAVAHIFSLLTLELLIAIPVLIWHLWEHGTKPYWRVCFYFVAAPLFHAVDFWIFAVYTTPQQADAYSLMFSGGSLVTWLMAHVLTISEVLFWVVPCWSFQVRWFCIPGWLDLLDMPLPYTRPTATIGLLLMVVGQGVRILAMAHAGPTFNHMGVRQHDTNVHRLVRTGIYGWLRHPSYFGMFWYAVGLQLVLKNMLCLIATTAVLGGYFAGKMRKEEVALLKLHGVDYDEYRQQVRTGMFFNSKQIVWGKVRI